MKLSLCTAGLSVLVLSLILSLPCPVRAQAPAAAPAAPLPPTPFPGAPAAGPAAPEANPAAAAPTSGRRRLFGRRANRGQRPHRLFKGRLMSLIHGQKAGQ